MKQPFEQVKAEREDGPGEGEKEWRNDPDGYDGWFGDDFLEE